MRITSHPKLAERHFRAIKIMGDARDTHVRVARITLVALALLVRAQTAGGAVGIGRGLVAGGVGITAATGRPAGAFATSYAAIHAPLAS